MIKTNHRREVLSKYVTDKDFNMAEVAICLDMLRMGSINFIKNLAVGGNEDRDVGL